MMAQWYGCKKKAKDGLLLFRLGDFYETFYEDALILARELDLTLTKRQNIPMSGVPYHAAEGYIEKLVDKGYLVAIAEQTEEAEEGKGLVKREIVRTVSKGTLFSSSLLSERANNFFASIAYISPVYGLTFLDLSTGELRTLELETLPDLKDELFRNAPSEILIPEKCVKPLTPLLEEIKKSIGVRINIEKDAFFEEKRLLERLINHFQVESLSELNLKEKIVAAYGSAALLCYIEDRLKVCINHIKQIQVDTLANCMIVDQSTERHLELIKPLNPDNKKFTLLALIDRTLSPMGARLIKSWVNYPLLCPEKIKKRQDAIEELLQKDLESLSLRNTLKSMRDFERLIMRISTGLLKPRDLVLLSQSLRKIPTLRNQLACFTSDLLKTVLSNLLDPTDIVNEIERTLVDNPPLRLGESRTIRPGFNSELDELFSIKTNSHSWLATYQTELREKLNIKTLKVIYNKTFGYCIEVSRGQSDRVPKSFQRRQTLVNAERFISEELKTYEEKIFAAEEQIERLENSLYKELCKRIGSHANRVKKIAKGVANLDCLLGLMHLASESRYSRPLVDQRNRIEIQEGSHPVIRNSLSEGSFIPNDTHLDPDVCMLMLITGPNMAGKSTYIRQVALIVIMAQIGSYVPAQSAQIGIVDKIFSRIGASDDLSSGRSTFMVEMSETANILHNATPRSLVILDEIGRGTSTYDGISIAWSVAKYLLNLRGKGVKTLFATHYFELTELEKSETGVKNFHITVKEYSDEVVFLRKIAKGRTNKSYGIHVARLAGFPTSLIQKAKEKLNQLESKKKPQVKNAPPPAFPSPIRLPLAEGEVIEELKRVKIDETTPLGALETLLKWQRSLL